MRTPSAPLEYLIKRYGSNPNEREFHEMKDAWVKAFRPDTQRTIRRRSGRFELVASKNVRSKINRQFRDFMDDVRSLAKLPDIRSGKRSNNSAARLAPYVAAASRYTRSYSSGNSSETSSTAAPGSSGPMSFASSPVANSTAARTNAVPGSPRVPFFNNNNDNRPQLKLLSQDLQTGRMIIMAKIEAVQFLDPSDDE